VRKGNIHLRVILGGGAISAAKTKGSCLKHKHHRLKARRGALRAALAIAQKILVSAYHMLAKNFPYRDLGEAYLDQIGQSRTVSTLKRRLEHLGYRVILEPNAQATRRQPAAGSFSQRSLSSPPSPSPLTGVRRSCGYDQQIGARLDFLDFERADMLPMI
jgi:hypothetical protein